MTPNESNRICQIHGVAHPDGIMHIAAAAVPVGASFGRGISQEQLDVVEQMNNINNAHLDIVNIDLK